jgi:iron complex outermembrane receptor protein
MEVFHRNWDATDTTLMAGAMPMGAMQMTGDYMDQTSIPNVGMLIAGAYGEYQRTFFQKLRVQAGGRLDTARSDARSPMLNTDLFWAYNGTRLRSSTDTNPAGNMQLSYALGKGVSLFGGVGRTVRLPDPEERYFTLTGMGSDWVGNPTLRPTQNTETDLGINYAGGRFQVRPTLFYSRLTDFIILHNQPLINDVMSVTNMMAKSYENVDAKLYGGELTYSVGITRSLLLLGGTSYSVGINTPRPKYNIFSTNLAEIPPLKNRTVLRYGTKRFFGEVEGTGVDAQNRVDTDLGEMKTPGYFTMGLKAGLHTSKINLAAGIDNLLNRFYYEYLSYQRDPFRSGVKIPEPGRNVYLTVSFAF